MQFIKIGMEDESQTPDPSTENAEQTVDLQPNETERAIEAVNNQESTEPARVLQVANYKQELALLEQQQDNEQETGTTDDGTGTTDENPNPEDGAPPEEPEGDTEPEAEPEEEPEQEPEEGDGEGDEDEPTSDEAEPVNTDAEMGSEGVGKDSAQVAQEQYIIEGHKMVRDALESMEVMGKYHAFLEKRSSRGGISQTAAKVVNQAFEHYADICGYTFKTPVPALESYQNYSSGSIATEDLKVAIEGFLESVWEAIKKFFKSIYTWVMDIITPKKPSVAVPADKATRDKAVKELEAREAELLKVINNVDRARERDEARRTDEELDRKRREARDLSARINKKIAASLFKTSDKGSFNEISQNVRMLAEVVSAAEAFTRELANVAKNAGLKAIGGIKMEPSELSVTKNKVRSITFNQENRVGNRSAVFEAITDEILGGIGARFVFAGEDVDAISKTIGTAKVIRELGYQGYKMTSVHEKSGFPTQLPELSQGDIQAIKAIIPDVDKAFDALNKMQGTVVTIAGMLKKVSDGSQPASWANLSKEDISHLREQANLVGVVETSVAVGYKTFNDQVVNFKNAYHQLLAQYV